MNMDSARLKRAIAAVKDRLQDFVLFVEAHRREGEFSYASEDIGLALEILETIQTKQAVRVTGEREIASVLAGLRLLQQSRHNGLLPDILDIASNGGEVVPLDDEEIDKLCEALNCGGKNSPEVRTLVLTGDGEIYAIFVLPEDAMSEEGMGPVDDAASYCSQRIRNLIPEALPSLEAVERRIREMSSCENEDVGGAP